ncbi:MAG TPA: hypothetical protein VIG06_31575 [Kofleriaceae bacterium]
MHSAASGLCRLAAAVSVAIALAPAPARAVENGGTVTGAIALADPAKRGEPPIKSQGFVRRARNALKAPRPFDPTPHLVVVLEGGTPAQEDSEPPPQMPRYTIIGESFDAPVLPIVAGSAVEIKNSGKGSPRLFSPEMADLVPGDPVSPKGERKTKKLDKAGVSYEIRDRESAHFTGRIAVFPHRYFARVKPDGKFEIKGVAPGSWKVRVWYVDGWVETPAETIEVVAKKEAKLKQPIAIPPRLTSKSAP